MMDEKDYRIRELEEALRWLIVQIGDVKRTSVVRESYIYKHAVQALDPNPESETDDG